MTNLCACGYPAPANLHQCGNCFTRMQTLLERVPDTLDTARTTLNNMGVQPRVGSAGTSAPGTPVNLDMSERLGEYVRRLVELAVWVNDQEEPNKPRIFTTPVRAAEYLRALSNLLRQREYVGDLYTELANLEHRVLSAADRPLVKRPLGECGALEILEDNTVTRCSGTIYGHETATTGRCDTCHREHDATARITARISEAWHVRAPLRQVVQALKAAGHTINYNTALSWVHRGKLAPTCDLATRQEGHTPAEVLKLMSPK